MEENRKLIVKNNGKEDDINKTHSTDDCLFGLGLLGRIIFTLYSLHGLFFIYNFIIQYIIVFPSLLYTGEIPGWLKIPFSVIYIIFALFSSNILVIPTFEFFCFPFLLYKNPFCHFLSFIYIIKGKKFDMEKEKEKHNKPMSIFFIIIEVIYFIALALGYFSKSIKMKDYIKLIILIIIYFHYLNIIFSYFIFSLFLIGIIIKNLCKDKDIRKIFNPYFKKRPKIPSVNLFSHIINPFILKNYVDKDDNIYDEEEDRSCYCEDVYFIFMIIFKLIVFVYSIFCFVLFVMNYLNFWLDFLFLFFIFFIMNILSITLNFPMFYRNRKTFGFCCCKCGKCELKNNICSTDIEYTIKFFKPHVVSFSRFISNAIFAFASITFIYIYFFRTENTAYKESNFKNLSFNNKKIDTKKLLLPNMCYSSVYNIPLQLFLPFINDAYYFGNIKSDSEKSINSSLNINEYKKIFFDDDYEIDIYGNLIEKENTVKMVQYNVKNQKNSVTILSIKGTSYNTDIYLDSQLYFSSILLNILSTFSLLTQKDSLTFNFIEYSLNIPYRIFFRFLLIDQYMTDLKDAFIKNEYSFYQNVIIVGHSLGGGLAKLFGRYIGKQAISLSGPGINAFHSLWNYKGTSENFAISSIDLVPDMDLVPRVEVSGGTIYRIICKIGVFGCHGKELSLCEVLIMCRNPIYEQYCKEFAGLKEEQINEIIKSSELNMIE